MNICREFYSERHLGLATLYNNFSCAYECLGQHDRAIEYHTKAIYLTSKVYDGEHPVIA